MYNKQLAKFASLFGVNIQLELLVHPCVLQVDDNRMLNMVYGMLQYFPLR